MNSLHEVKNSINELFELSYNLIEKIVVPWLVVITTAQLHSTKPKLRFCAGSNPARCMSEIRNGEELWQWSRLEIRLNAFCWSTIPQKQFIIIYLSSSQSTKCNSLGKFLWSFLFWFSTNLKEFFKIKITL